MQRAGVLPVGIEEEPDHEGKPHERHPLMLVVGGIDLVPDCLNRLHRLPSLSARACGSLSSGTGLGHNPVPDHRRNRQGQCQVESSGRQRQTGEHRHQKTTASIALFAAHNQLLIQSPRFLRVHDPKPRVAAWWVPQRGLRFVLSRSPASRLRGPLSLVRHRGDR